MPSFRIQPSQGDAIIIEAERAPTEQEAAEIFAQIGKVEPVKRPQTEFSDPRKMTLEEFTAKTKLDEQKDFTEKTGDFFTGVGQGILQMGRTAVGAVGETTQAASAGELSKIAKSLPEGIAKSLFDIAEIGEAIGGRAGDLFVPEDQAIERQFNRFMQDIEDQDIRRAGLIFSEEETLPQLSEAFSVIADPTNLIGVGLGGKILKASRLGKAAERAGTILDVPSNLTRRGVKQTIKAGARALGTAVRVTEKPLRIVSKLAGATEEVVGLPRVAATNITAKVLGLSPKEIAQVQNITKFGTPFVPALGSLGKAELAAAGGRVITDKFADLAVDASTVLKLLGDQTRQIRFLDAVLLDPSVSKSVKRAVSIAGTGGEKALDIAFNSVANGVSAATLQGVLATLATDDPETIGQAVGTGLAFGGALPIGRVPGAAAPTGVLPPTRGAVQQRPPIQAPQAQRGAPRAPTQQPTPARPFVSFQAKTKPPSIAKSIVDPARIEQAAATVLQQRGQQAQNSLLQSLNKQDRSLFSMLTFAGADMDIRLLDNQTFKFQHELDTGQPPQGRAFFEDENGTVWVDSSHKNITPDLVDRFTNRVGTDLVNNNPEIIQTVAIDFTDPDGKSFPIDASDPESPSVQIGGDLLREIEAFNKVAPEANQISDLTGGVSRYLDVNVDRLFNQSNVEFLQKLGDRPATKNAIQQTAHGALSRLGLVDTETGSPLSGKNLSPLAKNLATNSAIIRGISNLDRVNNNIIKTRERDAKAQRRKAKEVQKAQAKQSKAVQEQQEVLAKQEVKTEGLESRLLREEELRNKKGKGAQRSAFLAEKKKILQVVSDRPGPRATDARLGLGNEGISLSDAALNVYKSQRITDTVKTLESNIINNQETIIRSVITASRSRAAREKLAARVEPIIVRAIPLDFQVPKSKDANTLTNVRVIDKQFFIEEVGKLKDAGQPITIEGALIELDGIRGLIRQGIKLNDPRLANSILLRVIEQQRGVVKQFDPRNIVSLQTIAAQ